MNKLDLITIALKNLTKRKVRTFLTILSVIIGATSIIVMVSLGVALDEKFNAEIENIGSMTVIELQGYNERIEKKEIEKIKNIQNIKAISPVIQYYDTKLILDGKYVGTFDTIGLDASVMSDFGYEVEEGRLLQPEDANKYNIVFGDKTIYGFSKKGKAEPWYKYVDSPEEIEKAYKADVLNGSLKITTDRDFGVKKEYTGIRNGTKKSHKSFRVNGVGVLKASDDYSIKHKIFMPYETVEKLKKEVNSAYGNKDSNDKKNKLGYEKALVKVDSFDNVERVIEDIKAIFKESKKEIGIFSEAEFIQSSKRMTSMVQALLGGIGGISLFIAAIGITNTMIMSIYERTKEIGIMKVIGARVSDIKKLFLLEAALIGFIGGVFGVIISYIISFGINKFGVVFVSQVFGGELGDLNSKLSSIPLWLAVSSLFFASLIGFIAGYLPAKKIVKIEALKAIKSE